MAAVTVQSAKAVHAVIAETLSFCMLMFVLSVSFDEMNHQKATALQLRQMSSVHSGLTCSCRITHMQR